MNSAAFPRIFPFALFMLFIGLEEALRFAGGRGWLTLGEAFFLYLYPVKSGAVALSLAVLWKNYEEVRVADLALIRQTVFSIFIGLVVFVLWINMDWPFAALTTPQGFNTSIVGENSLRYFLTGSKLIGAVLVVPVMEELFWRSFLIRYFAGPVFCKLPIGHFTWASFLIVSVLFGLEHSFVLAGIMAGVAFNAVLYYTKSISQCILCHATTNLALGIYVLNTGHWKFW
jgi:uncharacterized protein